MYLQICDLQDNDLSYLELKVLCLAIVKCSLEEHQPSARACTPTLMCLTSLLPVNHTTT